jgi:hypothetical protein
MKKAVIVLLSISMVLMLTGFAFVAAGGFVSMPNMHFSSSGDKYDLLPNAETTERTADAQNCKTIELDTVNSNFEVINYDGSYIKLDFESIYKNEWSYSFSGSTMKLENKKYSDLFEGFKNFYGFLQSLSNGSFNLNDFGNSMMHSVKLYIPSGAAPQVNITNVNGSVVLSGINAKSLSFNLVNSRLDISDTVSSGDIKIVDVNGEINIKNLKAPSLNLSGVVNGQCAVDNPQFDSIEAKGFVNASLNLTSVTDPEDYSVSYSIVNGGVKIGDNSFKGNGSYSGGTAKCKVNFAGVNGNLYIGQ